MSVDLSSVTTLNMDFDNARTDLYARVFDFLRLTEGRGTSDEDKAWIKQLAQEKYQFEPSLYNIALSEKEKTKKFFDDVIHLTAYNSSDGDLFEKFLIDWYAAHRTLGTSMKEAVDPFFLTNEELDLMIESFGFPYSQKIISRRKKVSFLYNLIQYYHKKGTPYVFGEALGHFGLEEVIITEWWLRRDSLNNLIFKSKPVYPRTERSNTDLITTKSFDGFNLDIHWHQSEAIINQLSATTDIGLPSITPYISIHSSFDILSMMKGLSIIQELVQETYTFWIEYVLQYTGTAKKFITNSSQTVTEGETYIIGSTATGVFYEKIGYYAIKSGNVWSYSPPTKNDVTYLESTSSHHVYNGTNWIDLGVTLPSTLLNNTNFGELNKPIRLLQFAGETYSIIEIMLAIGYLFNSLENTNDSRFVKYGGLYSPLDWEVDGLRNNNINDPNAYYKIYEEWDEYNSTPTSRADRDSKYSYLKSNFQHAINNTDTNNHAYIYGDTSVFLQAINIEFKYLLDDFILDSGSISVLDNMMSDFERYTNEVAKIIDVPYNFLLTGFSIYSSYRNIVDFFKPYRARIHSFVAKVGILDKVGNKVITEDENTRSVEYFFVDQAPRDHALFDSSTVTDSLSIDTRYGMV